MINYQYFIIGQLDASQLHNQILNNSDLSSLITFIQIAQGTNSSASNGYYIFIYFSQNLTEPQLQELDSIVQNYSYS